MTFLSPASLGLIGLVGLVVILYLLRMPRKRVRVPDAVLAKLVVADKSRINRQKRTMISLALQIAILGLLVTAAALPFAGKISGEKRSIVVLLDVSASMCSDDAAKFRVLGDDEKMPVGGMTRFDKAIAAVKGMARSMNPGDRMMLLTVGRTVDVAFNYQSDTNLILRLLDALSPTVEEANFKDACRMAAGMGAGGGVEIVVVTDGAIPAEDLKDLAELDEKFVKLIKVAGENAGGGGNVGITHFSVRKNLDSSTDYEAMVTLTSTFDEDMELELHLRLNDVPFDIATVKVPAKGQAVQVFQKKLHVGGILEARLQIVDALANDNVAWAILRPTERLRVLLVSDDTNANSFLVRAVGSDAGAVEGMIITPEQYSKTIAANPEVLRGQRDAVIFDRWIPKQASEMPPTHVLAVDCVPPEMPVEGGEQFDKPLIRKWEAGHPLMSYLNLRDVYISTARKVNVNGAAKGDLPVERVAELVTSPLILAWERAGSDSVSRGGSPRRFVLMAFDPRESDIVLRKELPLLLWNSFLWFARTQEPTSQVEAGGTITIDADDENSVMVTTSAGVKVKVPADVDGKAYFSATREAGVYRYRVGAKDEAFVVNCGQDMRVVEEVGLKAEAWDGDRWGGVGVGGRQLWIYLLA
ncbi:MAG: BatA and WFA domain-containing protein, partial [Phycisphaerales bacterium]|nr:BatA and WFA domain-containing protein [Phycisphaerales bacterium]